MPFRNWCQADVDAHQQRVGAIRGVSPLAAIADKVLLAPKSGQPNKTELEYQRLLSLEFPGSEIRFESFGIKMSNGHRYTPDWIVFLPDTFLLVEVKARGKNGFRHPSYQRAKLAYDQCKVEFPQFRYRWAEKSKGIWEVP